MRSPTARSAATPRFWPTLHRRRVTRRRGPRTALAWQSVPRRLHRAESMAHDHAVVVGGTKGPGRVGASRFLARGFRVTVISRKAPDEMVSPSLAHVAVDLET